MKKKHKINKIKDGKRNLDEMREKPDHKQMLKRKMMMKGY